MQKTIVLTFDDAVPNHCDAVAPLLRELGFGATFYICSFPDAPESAFMTPAQLKSLDEQGFEIGNHTLNHNIAPEAAESEIIRLEERLAAIGISRPVTFAYPGGPYRQYAAEMLKSRGYLAARTTEQHDFVFGRDDPMRFPSFSVVGNNGAFEQGLEIALSGGLTSLVYHGVPDFLHPWVDTPPEIFTDQMHRLSAAKIKVIALRTLFEASQPR